MEYKKYALKDIGEIVSGATPKTSDPENFGGSIAWLTPADLSGYSEKYISCGARNITQKGYDSCSTQLMPPGTILFSSRAPIGYVAIAKNSICTNQGFKSVVPKSFVNNEYLYYQLIYLRKSIQDMGSGTTFKEISAKKFGTVQVVIPPISEQERIVARIEELFSQLDASVSELRTAKERLKVYRQAVYSSIYEGLSDMHPITEFFDVTGGLTKNSKRNAFPIKMPYLRVANVYYNKLDLTEIKEIGVTEREVEPALLKANDLLFVEGNGSKSQIGRVAIWDGSISNCLHQNHLIQGRPFGNMLSKYALYYLISRDGRKQIVEVAKSTSGLYTLSINKVKNLMVPYCDLAHQSQLLDTIDERISSCTAIEKTVDTALQQAEALRQSILKKAFEGGLV